MKAAVWHKFPGICPYCFSCHTKDSKCSKGSKEPIDIWRLRDLANERFKTMPRALRAWEKMFTEIYPTTAALGFDYLSKKLVEELGEVGGELTKTSKRVTLLQETGIDSLAFEAADIFAWTCQASNALRTENTHAHQSVLANSLANRLKYEICPFCKNAICTCGLEFETEQRKMEYRYLD